MKSFKQMALFLPLTLIQGCEIVDTYTVERHNDYSPTGTLPVLCVETSDGKLISSRTEWKGAVCTLDGQSMEAKVKGRGNSTWSYPKRPYSIKLTEPEGLLGMAPATRWNLLANFLDPTEMRNAVTFEMARATSLDWTPEGRFVELVVNGTFMGNYYLTEKVEIGPERISVGDGGNLVCMDSYYDELYRFRTKRRNLPVNILPATGTALDKAGFNSVRSRYDTVEEALYGGSGEAWQDLLDAESFCDWYIIQEISTNTESRWPKSVYMHTGADGKIHAGPVWDYDYSAYRKDVPGLVARGDLWYDALLKDPSFVALLKERWAALKPRFEEIAPAYLARTAEEIGVSARQDGEMWPVSLHINGDEQMGFDEAAARLEQTILGRIATLDALFAAL